MVKRLAGGAFELVQMAGDRGGRQRIKLSQPNIEHELAIHNTVRHPNIIQILAYCLKNNYDISFK